MSEKLKPCPCPICGENLVEEDVLGVIYVHPAIDCMFVTLVSLESDDDIEAWNNRPIEDELNRKIEYYEKIIHSCKEAEKMIALEGEVERKRQIIIAMQDCVGCGEPLWGEVQGMIEADARIIAELQEPVIIDLTEKGR